MTINNHFSGPVIALAAAVALSSVSCSSNPNGQTADDQADTTAIADTAATVEAAPFVAELTIEKKKSSSHFERNNFMEDGVTEYLTKEYEIEWPSSANYNITPLQSAICKALFDKSTTNLDDAAKLFLNKLESEYEGFVRTNGKASETDEFEYSYSLSYSCNQVADPTPRNTVSFVLGGYDFQGGAHGQPLQFGVINYDCEKEQVIDYKDIFVPNCDRKILSLLKAARKKDIGNGDGSLPDRVPKDMMYIGADNVTFQYTAYELGPYVEGEVELTLTRSQIEEYLTDYGKELFNR